MAQAYDEVPYPDFAFSDQHPFHLCALAHLRGGPTPSLDGGRVLEIGCAGGANLLFMAETAPQMQFVGVELSKPQALRAMQRVQESGLSNISIIEGSFTDLPKSLEPFDFILAHGLLSWISPELRASFREIVRERLSPNGILYVSYNCFPGWMFKGYVRELLLRFIPRDTAPAEQLLRIKELLPKLAALISPFNPARSWLVPLLEKLQLSDPSYLLHEYLSEWNESFWIDDLIREFSANGLFYLGETDPSMNAAYDISEAGLAAITSLAQETSQREQALDFARCPAFRRSLFCRAANQSPDLCEPSRIKGLSLGFSPSISLASSKDGGFELGKQNCASLNLNDAPAACVGALVRAHPGYATASQIATELHRPENEIHIIVHQLIRAGYVTPLLRPLPITASLNSSCRIPFVTKLLARTSNTTVTARGERIQLTDAQRAAVISDDFGQLTEALKESLRSEGLLVSEAREKSFKSMP